MGRQNGDSTMVGSSIALLQERFRELQRVKEDREKKELRRLYSGYEPFCPWMHYDQPAKLGYQQQQEMMFLPSKPSLLADSLSLGLKSQSNRADFQVMTGTSLTNSRPSVANSSKQFYFDSSDVDTTLHL
ncbi:hypothetical protein HS088_TW06G00324 [Tripterygium wilfordii]|uniref:Uncharacterized protein n=1 Tax=Tripterygium wilfordii TaxID=458696 RepID=A0A7J7DIP0_TRIWF|nr:uncharacterized protein LOC120000106 [Tripterygium wilfordii]KAF5746159.1 hypothetical protein HS088_TW06G00324 [Tripterygium wilfordii]